MSPEEREPLLEAIHAFTDATPTRERLERELDAIRARGWSSSSGEREKGVGSVSAPVFGPGGTPLAVVSVSGPATRIRRLDAKRYASAVTRGARRIERALGTAGPVGGA
jgi:DNA-binding IclR family transcriptional regulator